MDLLRPSRNRLTAAALGAVLILALPATGAAVGISGQLKRATGHSSSQLTTRPVCAGAGMGRIRCLAQVLAVKATGRAAALLRSPRAVSGSAAPAAYSPAFLQWAYDTTWLSANSGAADTVAIVDAYGDSSAYSDMAQFRSANGLPALARCTSTLTTGCFELVNQSGQSSPLPGNSYDETGSWNIEESLDIDAVSSLCPLCKIVVVEANTDDYNTRTGSSTTDLETAVQAAAALGANQISLSWGADTPPDAASWSWPYTSIHSAAILAAAGDSSYPGPDVGYPAALPDVTAVGGTSLSASPSTARGFQESAWAIQTCSGGGTCGTESGCDTSQPRPSYQSATVTGCNGRAYSDISADADPNTGLAIYDSQPGSEGCGGTGWCIVGGTSLATPLTAALEGLTGVSDTTPAWTYSSAAALNDIVSGSDGTCPSGWSLICNAALGWDGPTGNGSISGDLIAGGPGIGGSNAGGVNAQDVTLAGGVYPNGASTSYHWEYWPSTGTAASASDTPAATVGGASLQSVSSTICAGLSPGTTYDYALVASNSSGTADGYQRSFTTSASEAAPSAAGDPTVSGSATAGQTLGAQDANWSDQSCNSAPSHAWQESASTAGPWTTVGTALSYRLTSADAGAYLRFTSTESNQAGSTTLTSQVVGPVIAATATTTTSTTAASTTSAAAATTTAPAATTSTGTASASTTTATTTTTPAPPPPVGSAAPVVSIRKTVRFYRCARRCVLIRTHGRGLYRPRRVDYGRYIKVLTTLTRTASGRRTTSVSTRWIGPVTSATAGDIMLRGTAHAAAVVTIRSRTGRPLARVTVARLRGRRLRLVISRRAHARTRVWAYAVRSGRVISATNTRVLAGRLTLRLKLGRGQALRLVAVES